MLKIGRLPIYILIINIALFFIWNLIFTEDEWMRSVGGCVLQLIAAGFSFVWVWQACRKVTEKQKKFWLLLSIGLGLYFLANTLWLHYLIDQREVDFNDSSYLIWLLAYIFFLAALIIKTKEIGRAVSKTSYIFETSIFVITASAVSLHFLINPIIAYAADSPLITAISLIFIVVSLSILFVVTILYYLIKNNKEHQLMLYIVIGFILQVAADMGSAYLSHTGSFQGGNIVVLFWLLAIWMIGFAGLYAKEDASEIYWEIQNPFKTRENFFPYASVVIMNVLVVYSYDWNFNALSAGLTITFMMMIGRQLYIMNKNKKLINEYRFLAYHDPLTGLKNRASFNKDAAKFKEAVHHNTIAFVLLDLDRFKVINDTLGHFFGDKILIQTAERLKNVSDNNTSIYRLSGDEFVIILLKTSEKKCRDYAENLLEEFKVPFSVDGHEAAVTPSIGINIVSGKENQVEDFLKHADVAMYHAKENGKNNYSFYTAALSETAARKMMIENELQKAAGREQLFLVYQPKVNLLTKEIVGVEALLRWKHPELGFVSPGEFIPVAEDTGQIVSLGRWVMEQACEQQRVWLNRGMPSLGISVNVSVRQFQHSEFLKDVREILKKTGIKPCQLELEITESIMQDIEESTKILAALKKLGIQTSIDDFGKGYSSLLILQKLPIDVLKIDKSFIDDMENDGQQSIVKTIIAMGLNLNLGVIAEGIENELQLKTLIEYQCSMGQGYLFSKPVPPENIEEMLLGKKSRGSQTG
ncbi:putative bifunctional diguanylate cyclase/phosphodiesterase [Alkalicoccus daliensis]|uniref:Diguanylate cyclase (GGDEF) domain-containing protein n=1 Tax=Alkalicoccus daliensis TaxID=745820 RepID=A0A1H0FTE2_9BACI|nr:bifunctional diguanylate cyclase/phosphodiesterase [Alkalicoccus daliensis]SDN97910.1 diguanylate cyclase (GGDEF) domain-containing protein [Alkalicoccus daliensis]